jgi:hypothetical protein
MLVPKLGAQRDRIHLSRPDTHPHRQRSRCSRRFTSRNPTYDSPDRVVSRRCICRDTTACHKQVLNALREQAPIRNAESPLDPIRFVVTSAQRNCISELRASMDIFGTEHVVSKNLPSFAHADVNGRGQQTCRLKAGDISPKAAQHTGQLLTTFKLRRG